MLFTGMTPLNLVHFVSTHGQVSPEIAEIRISGITVSYLKHCNLRHTRI